MTRFVVSISTLTVLFTALSASTVSAQTPTPGVFGVGLSFISDRGTATGFALNVSKELTSGQAGIGPVGDFSLHRDDPVTWMAFSGGVRVTGHPKAPVMPFGQFLAGASVISAGGSDTFLTFVFGGGVHVALTEKLNLTFQFDLVNVHGEGDSETGKRTTIGISVPFPTR